MDFSFVILAFTSSWWFTWVGLPFLIILARATDQALGALRIVFVAKGMRYLAPLVGFLEAIIWLLAVSQILQHVNKIWYIIAYGLGYASGNFIGILLEQKLSLGRVIVRIITSKETPTLIHKMREGNFGVTVLDAEGSKGKVKLIFSVVERKHLQEIFELIQCWDPTAFYSVEEVKTAREGVFKPVVGPLSYFGLRKSK